MKIQTRIRSCVLALACTSSVLFSAGPGFARTRPPGVGSPGAAPPPAGFSKMSYHSGRVISPVIDRLYWGSFTQNEINDMETYLAGLVQYMNNQGMTPGEEPTVRQYGVWGAFLGTSATDTSVPTTVQSQANIQSKIAAVQQAGTLPAYSPQRLVLVFTRGISMDANYAAATLQGWCAYHTSAGTDKFWGVVPFPTGNCNAANEFQAATSHEIFEAATDPDLTAGWFGANGIADEIADSCNGQNQAITLPNGTAGTIQRIADNIQSNCSISTVEEEAPLAPIRTAAGGFKLDVLSRGSDGALKSVSSNDGVNWGAFQDLGGGITEAPAAVAWGSSFNLESVVVRGLDGAVYHKFFDGTNWSDYQALGGVIIGPPTIIAWRNSSSVWQVNIFGRGVDGKLYSWWSTDGLSWSTGLVGVPSGVTMVSPPRAVSRSLPSFDVFFTATDSHLYQLSWSGTAWSSFKSLGGQSIFLPGFAPFGSALDVFARGVDNDVLLDRFQTSWSGFTSFGGIISGSPAPVRLATTGSTIDAFARGQGGLGGGTLWTLQSNNGGTTFGWYQLDTTPISSAPAVVKWGSALDHESVFMRKSDGTLGHKLFDGTNWNLMQNLGGSLQ